MASAALKKLSLGLCIEPLGARARRSLRSSSAHAVSGRRSARRLSRVLAAGVAPMSFRACLVLMSVFILLAALTRRRSLGFPPTNSRCAPDLHRLLISANLARSNREGATMHRQSLDRLRQAAAGHRGADARAARAPRCCCASPTAACATRTCICRTAISTSAAARSSTCAATARCRSRSATRSPAPSRRRARTPRASPRASATPPIPGSAAASAGCARAATSTCAMRRARSASPSTAAMPPTCWCRIRATCSTWRASRRRSPAR